MEHRVETIDPIRVAYVRGIGPYEVTMPKLWQTMMAFAQHNKLADAWRISIGWDNPAKTPPDKIRADACVQIPETLVPTGDILVQTIPGGKFLIATYVGGYEGLANAWQSVMRDFESNGHAFRSGPPFEHYCNSMMETPAEQLMTDLYVPIE